MSATKPRRRTWKKLTVGILLTSAALWCLFWLTAPKLSSYYFEEWLSRESALGRKWTCETKTSEGFPLAYRFKCENLTLAASSKSGPLSLKIGGISVEYSPYRPLQATIDLYGPAQFGRASDVNIFKTNWDKLTVTIKPAIFGSPVAELSGRKISIEASLQEGKKIETIELELLTINLSTSRNGPENEALIADVSAGNISAQILDSVAGNTGSGHLNTIFEIHKFNKLKRGDLAARLDSWRAVDGLLKINDFKATKGDLAVEATGVLQIDAQRRPIGQLNTRAAGLSNLLSPLGMSGSSGAVGGMLGGLFRKSTSNQTTTEPANQRFISLPLILLDGSIWLGPIKTPLTTRPLL